MYRLNHKRYFDKTYNFAEVSELLNLPFGRNKLYKMLVEIGLLDDEHRPCKSMLENKCMTYRDKLVPKNRKPHLSIIPFFTERGLRYLDKLLKEKGMIS